MNFHCVTHSRNLSFLQWAVKDYEIPLLDLLDPVIMSGHIPSIEYVFSQINTSKFSSSGWFLFMSAIRSGSTQTVERLMDLLNLKSPVDLSQLLLWCTKDENSSSEGILSYLYRKQMLNLPSNDDAIKLWMTTSLTPTGSFLSTSTLEFCLEHHLFSIDSILEAAILKGRVDIYEKYAKRATEQEKLKFSGEIPDTKRCYIDWYSVNRLEAVSLLKILHARFPLPSLLVHLTHPLTIISAEDIIELQSFGLNSPEILQKCAELSISSTLFVSLARLKLLIDEMGVTVESVLAKDIQRHDVLKYLEGKKIVH